LKLLLIKLSACEMVGKVMTQNSIGFNDNSTYKHF